MVRRQVDFLEAMCAKAALLGKGVLDRLVVES